MIPANWTIDIYRNKLIKLISNLPISHKIEHNSTYVEENFIIFDDGGVFCDHNDMLDKQKQHQLEN